MQYVVGHQNPDTDAICSAIVYAQYLQDTGVESEAVALGDPSTEADFVLKEHGVQAPEVVAELPEGAEIVLVDHNEASQSIEQRERYTLVGVIDHHKVADFVTSSPLMIRMEPIGSTCSLLAKIFNEQGYTPSQQTARLMISAIISDTLLYRSAITTEEDIRIVDQLNKIAQFEDIEAYGMRMFDAKSDISHLTAPDVVTMDYKTFEMSGKHVGVGVTETTNPSFALERKEELISAIQDLKKEQGLDYLLFCIVDILQEHTTALIADKEEQQLVEAVFDATVVDHTADLGARLSRKKQIVPPLDNYFNLL